MSKIFKSGQQPHKKTKEPFKCITIGRSEDALMMALQTDQLGLDYQSKNGSDNTVELQNLQLFKNLCQE